MGKIATILLLALLCLAPLLDAGASNCSDGRAAMGEMGPCVAVGALPTGNNVDASGSAPSLSGLNLLATIPPNPARLGYIVEAQDTAANCATGGGANALLVVLDDGAGGTPTILTLAYASAKGGQGGGLDMGGTPHRGRIRVFGTGGCRFAAAAF
jgi:hypothetical protein